MKPQNEILLEIHSALKSRGVLILDAHATAIDIFGTLIWLRLHFPKVRILVPVAGWLFYRFPNYLVIKALTTLFTIEVMPVYRSQELIPGEEQMYTKFYPKEITPEVKKERNHAYLAKARELLKTPNSILAVAPYGDPLKFGMNIKRGVLELLEKLPMTFVTWTKKQGFIYKTKIGYFHFDPTLDSNNELLLAFKKLFP